MKLLFTNFHAGDGGGHTTYVLTLASALSARHEVHVAAPPGSRLFREASRLAGVHTLPQPFPNGFKQLHKYFPARRQLSAYLRQHRFDVAHVNGSADHRLLIGAASGLRHRPAIVLTKHNSKPMTGIGHAWRARRGTDQVIAVCDYTHKALSGTAYRQCRLDTVHNGVDIRAFSPWPEDRALSARRQWVEDPGALVIGSNAGTAWYKGWMDVVESLALLTPEERTRVHVLLAGHLPGAAAKKRIVELGLDKQIHFPGLLADVRPMVAALDAGFVLSHDVETISFACREMMAMGKPVLVSNYAGLPENIRQGVDGWVVPARDRTAIAAAVRRLIEERDRLRSMGQAAHLHAMEEFGLERFVDRTEGVYLRLLQDLKR